MKPKLYKYAACPFCNKVAALLAYKGVDYEGIEVHPLKKAEIAFSTDYRAVPIYIDGSGKQINDSTPIMRHIDAEFPQNKVFRENVTEKAWEDQWLAWSEKLVQALPTVVYDTFPNSWDAFNYITKVGKFGWWDRQMVRLSGAFVMTLVSKKIRKRLQIENPTAFLSQMITEWSGKALSGNPYCGGQEPNAADIAVFGISKTVAELSAGKLFAQDAAFSAWYSRMAEKTSKIPAGV